MVGTAVKITDEASDFHGCTGRVVAYIKTEKPAKEWSLRGATPATAEYTRVSRIYVTEIKLGETKLELSLSRDQFQPLN